MTTIGAALVGGAWLWDKFGAKVVEQAGKLGGDAGHQLWGKFGWKAAAERYRQEMQMLYGTMRIIGMTQPVALADIFTDLFLLDKPTAWRHYNIKQLQLGSELDDQDTLEELQLRMGIDDYDVLEELQLRMELDHSDARPLRRRDALDLINRHQRLMILGKPGAGKTTLLKHLVLECTTGKLDAVPIFVGLKSWADSGLTLMPFVAQQFAICAFPEAQPFIEHILSEGQALVLFDGLDEVNLEQGARERITRDVRDFANQYPRSRCVITCRTAASDYQFERFVYCELADFTPKQMRTFVAHWFQRDQRKCEAFLEEFAKPDHDRLRDLARTPLLLTLLCLTFEETGMFPARRAEIYEEALDALLKKWDASRSIKRDTVYRTLSPVYKRQMLARIAAETFANDELFMRQDDLTRRIVAYLRRLPSTDVAEDIDGEAVLHSIEAQHGLLVERTQRIYSFSHLTFHEYLTARYTVDHPSRQMFQSVVDHAQDARWREVLLLTASLLDDTNAETFFNAFDAALRTIIQSNPILLPLWQWIYRTTENIAHNQQATIRGWYLVLALVSIAISHFRETRVLALARARARDLAHSSDRIYDHDLVRANLSALGGTFDRALEGALARALALVRPKNGTREEQRPAAAAFMADCVWTGVLLWVQVIANTDIENRINTDYEELLTTWRRHITDASPELRAALIRLTLPTKDAPIEDWQRFAADLQLPLAIHQDVGHHWGLETAPLERLTEYLDISTRMLECLDLAAVADRDAIRNRLLLPPQP